jgi:hypothetical protein
VIDILNFFTAYFENFTGKRQLRRQNKIEIKTLETASSSRIKVCWAPNPDCVWGSQMKTSHQT